MVCYTLIKAVKHTMMENGNMVLKMDMVFINTSLEMFIKVNGLTMQDMEKVDTFTHFCNVFKDYRQVVFYC